MFGQTTPAGPRAAALSWRIYAAPFPNAFIIPRCQRLAFSPVFVLLLSPRSSGSSPSLSLVHFPWLLPNSRPSTLHNMHEHRHSAHSRSHPSPPSFSSLLPLPSAYNAAVILVRFWHSRPLLCFLIFFLHHRIVARPFSGSGTNDRVSGPPCDAEFRDSL